MNTSGWKIDCRHFLGDRPCLPHRQNGVHCDSCNQYAPPATQILLVKLGAIGDVIRTTPLLAGLERRYPACQVTWVTDTPEVVPQAVPRVLRLDAASILQLTSTPFDVAINLDKDVSACALALHVQAPKKFGFILKQGKPAPVNRAAEHKFATGIFDDVSQANRKSYPQEIFEICELDWRGDEYVLDRPPAAQELDLPGGRPLVGLNTGCGGRWPSRLWPEASWMALAEQLTAAGAGVVLLGGPAEDALNRRLAAQSGSSYLGHFSLPGFVALVDQLDLVVSVVTMAMHIAIGLGKELVLLNNIFNPHEFELYGRGEVVSPPSGCDCFYAAECRRSRHCMLDLTAAQVFRACQRRLKSGAPAP